MAEISTIKFPRPFGPIKASDLEAIRAGIKQALEAEPDEIMPDLSQLFLKYDANAVRWIFWHEFYRDYYDENGRKPL